MENLKDLSQQQGESIFLVISHSQSTELDTHTHIHSLTHSHIFSHTQRGALETLIKRHFPTPSEGIKWSLFENDPTLPLNRRKRKRGKFIIHINFTYWYVHVIVYHTLHMYM